MGSAVIYKARIRVALYSSGTTFKNRLWRDLENTSRFELSFAEDEKKLADFRDATGGTDASSKRLADITGAMDARHLTNENMALGFWGTTSAYTATPIVAEAGFKIVPNSFLPTDRIIDTTVNPVLKKGATTIATVDYTASPGGVLIASTITTATVVSGDAVTIDYTPKASHDVQALVSSAPDISIHAEGINEVDGKYTIVKLWKVKLGVAQNVGFITEDFATLGLSLTVQKDLTIAGVGKSQYFMLDTQD